jgi:hypothetical protein
MGRISAEIIDGRLKVQVDLVDGDLEEKGDKPGHPFRGNQWEGGGSGQVSSSGLRGKDEQEKTAAVSSAIQRVAGVAERVVPGLGDAPLSIKLSGAKSFKSATGEYVGHYDQETGVVRVAAGGLPATSEKLNRGEISLASSVADVAVHEYAHHVLTNMVETKTGDVGRLVNIWKTQRKQVRQMMGQYAESHPSEMFCEGFLAYTHPTYGTKSGVKLPKALADYFSSTFGKGK